MAEPTGASQSVFSGSISDLKKKKVPPCGAASPIAIAEQARPPAARPPTKTLEARRKFGGADAAAARGRGHPRAPAAPRAARVASPRVSPGRQRVAARRGWVHPGSRGGMTSPPPPPRDDERRPTAPDRRHPIIQFCWGQEPH